MSEAGPGEATDVQRERERERERIAILKSLTIYF